MSTPPPTKTSRRALFALWAPGFLVALAAGVATAHGIYEVAAAVGTPKPIAWLYPLITDGLALVAYVSTSRLHGGGRAYAWAVVVLAAGVSGLAQAVFLAETGPVLDAAAPVAEVAPVAEGVAPMEVPAPLRFGVGAWPAIAAAIVAHLLFMLGEASAEHGKTNPAAASPERAGGPASTASPSNPVASAAADRTRPLVKPPVQPFVQPSIGQAVQPAARGVQPERSALDVRPPVQPSNPAAVHTRVQPAVQSSGLPSAVPGSEPVEPEPAPTAVERPARVERPRVQPVAADASKAPQKDRARAAARHHLHRTGQLPTVSELQEIADVARGTAGTALQELREQPADLHIVTHDEHLRNSS